MRLFVFTRLLETPQFKRTIHHTIYCEQILCYIFDTIFQLLMKIVPNIITIVLLRTWATHNCVNQCFWMKRTVYDSVNKVFWVKKLMIQWIILKVVLFLNKPVFEQRVSEQIGWVHSLTYIPEWVKCSEWINWVYDLMTRCWMNQVFWANQLSIWFNDSLLNESSVLSESIE